MRSVQSHTVDSFAINATQRRNTSNMSVPITDSGPRTTTSDPTGLHRVLDDARDGGRVLPQAAQRLDARREIWPDEVRVRVETLNLDAASFRQLEGKHSVDGQPDGEAVRREVLQIVAA